MPSVEVDAANNAISLRGNSNVVVQINGRTSPLRGDQLGTFLAQIPAATLSRIEVTTDVRAAVTGADGVYTDTWLSMGDPDAEKAARQRILAPYRVDAALMAAAKPTGNVQDAIRLLTPEQQQVVFLRFFEGLPHESVAAQMGRNPNAVRAIQFRALGRLRKLLEDDCAEPA